jgi:phage anti-repressor protein
MLTQGYIFSAFQAESAGNQFPLSFDEAWEKAGYARKDNAKKVLVIELVENEDYTILTDSALLRDLTTTGFFESFSSVPAYLSKNQILALIENETFLDLLSPQEKAVIARTEIIKLSTDGFDHFCMMARTEKGRETRKQFIAFKKQYIANLDRSLLLEADPRLAESEQLIAKLNQQIQQLESQLTKATSNHLEFTYSVAHLHSVSGISNKSQVKKAVISEFEEGKHYVFVDKEVFVNQSTFDILVMSFRSIKGTDLSRLPEFIRINTKEYFLYQEKKRKNSRLGQRKYQAPEGQQSLFEM